MPGILTIRGFFAKSNSFLLGRFDGQIGPISPFFPGADGISRSGEAAQTQGNVAVRGTVTTLAIGYNFFVRCDPDFAVHRRQLGVGFELALRVEVIGPFDMNRAGYRAATSSTHVSAEILAFRASVHN